LGKVEANLAPSGRRGPSLGYRKLRSSERGEKGWVWLWLSRGKWGQSRTIKARGEEWKKLATHFREVGGTTEKGLEPWEN